jgi:hypothetical protein
MSRFRHQTPWLAVFSSPLRRKVVATLWVCAVGCSWTIGARAASCVNDIDCSEGGSTCGTEVCDYNTNPPACAPAGQQSAGMDGWCTVTSDCKCQSLGATCAGTFCTFTTPPDGGAATASDAAASSQSSSQASTQSTGPSESASTESGLHSSSGCSMAPSSSPTAPSLGAICAGLAAAFAGRRRMNR